MPEISGLLPYSSFMMISFVVVQRLTLVHPTEKPCNVDMCGNELYIHEMREWLNLRRKYMKKKAEMHVNGMGMPELTRNKQAIHETSWA